MKPKSEVPLKKKRKPMRGAHGAMSLRIRRAYHPDLTCYEIAKKAKVEDTEIVRRILAYHGLRCVSLRERIDILSAQLEGKMKVRIILPKI